MIERARTLLAVLAYSLSPAARRRRGRRAASGAPAPPPAATPEPARRPPRSGAGHDQARRGPLRPALRARARAGRQGRDPRALLRGRRRRLSLLRFPPGSSATRLSLRWLDVEDRRPARRRRRCPAIRRAPPSACPEPRARARHLHARSRRRRPRARSGTFASPTCVRPSGRRRLSCGLDEDPVAAPAEGADQKRPGRTRPPGRERLRARADHEEARLGATRRPGRARLRRAARIRSRAAGRPAGRADPVLLLRQPPRPGLTAVRNPQLRAPRKRATGRARAARRPTTRSTARSSSSCNPVGRPPVRSLRARRGSSPAIIRPSRAHRGGRNPGPGPRGRTRYDHSPKRRGGGGEG